MLYLTGEEGWKSGGKAHINSTYIIGNLPRFLLFWSELAALLVDFVTNSIRTKIHVPSLQRRQSSGYDEYSGLEKVPTTLHNLPLSIFILLVSLEIIIYSISGKIR